MGSKVRSNSGIAKVSRKEPISIKTLGQAFLFYPLSEEEKARIGKRLADGALAKEALSQNCLRTDLYKELFHKFLGKRWLPSYRPYEEPYNKEALKRIEQCLREGNKNELDEKFCWDLYGYSAARYLDQRFPQLDKLLREVPWNEDLQPNSLAMIELVCKHAFDFEVQPIAIEALYELMWIERIEQFGTLLKLAAEPDKLAIQEKLSSRLSKELDNLRSDFGALKTEFAGTCNDLKETKTAAASAGKHFRSLETVLDDVTKRLSNCEETYASHEKSVLDLHEKLTHLHDLTANWKKSVVGLEARLSRLADKREIGSLAGELDSKLENMASTQALANIEVNNRFESLFEGLALLNQELNSFKSSGLGSGGTGKTYKSALSQPSPKAKVVFAETKEIDFVRYWHQHLLKISNLAFTVEQVLACHCCFLSNRVIVCTNDTFASWISCLGWGSNVLDLVASPLWSSESDWQEGAGHLFGVPKNVEPKIVNIHNYDVGLVDCFLIPTLHLWLLKSQNYPSFNKLSLIGSNSTEKQISQIHAYGVDISNLLVKDTDTGSLKLVNDVGRDFYKPIAQRHAVSPASLLSWCVTEQSDSILDQLEIAIGRRLNVELSQQIKSLCARTSTQCRKFFDENSSVYIAVLTHLLPWVMTKYGQHEHDMVKQYSVESLGIEI